MISAGTRARRVAIASALVAAVASRAFAQEALTGDTLYRMTLLRAATGLLLELVESAKANAPPRATGGTTPSATAGARKLLH